MKKALFFLAFLLFFSSSAVHAGERLNDIFTGTLEIQDGKPTLLRCDMAKSRYLLVDKKGNPEAYLKQLNDLGITPETPYQASFLGYINEGSNGTYTLTVDSIKSISKGSCHLF